jgi:soluble lytic murein transglycosylase
MMMKHSLERNIPGRWISFCLTFLFAVSPATLLAIKPKTSKAHKRSKSAVQQSPKPKAAGAAALLALAQRQLGDNNFKGAADYAKQAAKESPELLDYANLVRAEAEIRLGNAGEVSKSVARVLEFTPMSPLTGAAAALAVQADLSNGKPKDALNMIQKFYRRIPQPQADFLLASSFQATNDLAQAAEYFQRVYYGYPKTKAASDAETFLNDLKTKLGESYPPPMPDAMLGRAMKLIDSRDYIGARNELSGVIPQLGGPQRDLAQVRLGEVDFYTKDYAAAKNNLEPLRVSDGEADAERLDYLARSMLKIDKNANVDGYLDTLATKYPHSRWRLDILMTIGNQALVDNDATKYTRIFSACEVSFPKDQDAAKCHWRMAFEHYRKNEPGTLDELRSYVTNFPASNEANAALYFLGRLSERRDECRAARAYYDAILGHYPNTYYEIQARTRLKESRVRTAEPAVSTLGFLKAIDWPATPKAPPFEPDQMQQKRLNRSRLLHLALLDDWAELELSFGARNDAVPPYIYAYELAKIASARGAHDQSIRYIKSFAPEYLKFGADDVPASFWQYAFPIPYRVPLQRYSRQQGLDPYLVSALIRQESEFNPKVISYANAYGLMQVLPSTGRELARGLHIRHFAANDLLTPNRNLQLGTLYFHKLMASLDNREEDALAAFNAGKSRADLWRSWGPYREQAEFIETIPFTQTRNYVQVVLRNADMYRRLYAGTEAARSPGMPVATKASVAAKKPAVKKKAPVHRARRRTSKRPAHDKR